MAKPTTVYQLKVTLEDIKPAIWRRLQVPSDITLGKLHFVLQDALGWENSHLHHFLVGERRIGMVDVDEVDDELEDEDTVKLAGIVSEGGRFIYEYDFGDSWRHDILVEKVITVETKPKHPLCIDGGRACPPEDCGGTYGYADLLKALKRPTKRNAALREWLGDGYDPESFDPASTNAAIRANRTRRLTRY
jgi:hypothetical protein